ncbi:MAG: AI-2E family transporter [Frankiales bacterium]|nr:AI-2E family transporter [Frankiales bacterium]
MVEDGSEDAERAAAEAEAAAQEAEQARDEASEAREQAAEARDEAAAQAERVEEAVELVAPVSDPVLDTGVRRIEAQVDEDNPFGRPGRPMGQRGPFRIAFIATLGVAAAALLVDSVIIARQVLILILIAAFMAVGLDPAVRWLVGRGLKRSIAVLVIIVAALGFFGGFVAAVAPPIAKQSSALVKQAPAYVERLDNNSTIKRLDDRYHFVANLRERAKKGVNLDALGGLFGVSKAILGIIASTFTVIILTIYFLANMPGIKRTLYRMAPRTRRARVGLLTDEILNRVGGYVLGNLATSLVAGLATFIWLIAWGVPYPVALAMFVAITDLIPLIGATIGAIGVTGVALFHGLPVGIATFAFYVAYQQFENYVLQPRVMKRTVDVAPVVTIVSALLGAALLGILGALIAVPIAAGIQLLLAEVAFPRQDEL